MTVLIPFKQQNDPQRLAVAVILGLVALSVVRLVASAFIELMPEEAYYWTYFQHPSLSYYDHPPMVAWCIGLGTMLFGDTEFGVRFVTIVLSVAASALMFKIARFWFGRTAAWWAVALFNVLPIYLGMGMFAFPDGPLVCFWLLALYGMSQVLVENRSIGWLWAGLGFGGALLSKYTAVLFAPSVLLFLLLSRPHRHWLRRPQPWLALGLGLALFAPVVIWNSQHNWVSFLFQSTRTIDAQNQPLRNAAIFWLYQLGILTPPVFALFVRSISLGCRSADASWRFAFAFAAPFLLVFLAASFKTQIHLNWTAPGFLALIPGAASLAAGRFAQSRAWRIAGWMTGGLAFGFLVIALSGLLFGHPKVFAASNVGGWRLLAQEVERAEHELEIRTGQTAFVLGADKYNLAAELSFYTREPEEVINMFALGAQGLGFRYWTDLQAWKGHPALAVLTAKFKAETLLELRRHFTQVDEPRRLEVPSLGKRQRVVYLVDCYGYRCQPSQSP